MMDDQHEEASRIQGAVRRLSSVFKRRAKPGSDGMSRLRRSKRDSACVDPNKEEFVLSRSALKGNRWSCILDERRVDFADWLPRVDFGPPFRLFDAASIDGEDGSSVSATSSDDKTTPCRSREAAGNRKRACTGPTILESATRHDSSTEPIVVPEKETGTLTGNSNETIDKRHLPTDHGRTVKGDATSSQNSLWPLPLFANRSAGDRSSGSAVENGLVTHDPAAAQLSHRGSQTYSTTSATDNSGHASVAYQAHVDRSLQSIRGPDKRRSTYLRDSLVQMQEALDHSNVENIGNGEHQTGTGNATTSVPVRATGPDNVARTESRSDDQLAPSESPPPIPPRHPGRRLIHMINDMRCDASAESLEEKESARDSGISVSK